MRANRSRTQSFNNNQAIAELLVPETRERLLQRVGQQPSRSEQNNERAAKRVQAVDSPILSDDNRPPTADTAFELNRRWISTSVCASVAYAAFTLIPALQSNESQSAGIEVAQSTMAPGSGHVHDFPQPPITGDTATSFDPGINQVPQDSFGGDPGINQVPQDSFGGDPGFAGDAVADYSIGQGGTVADSDQPREQLPAVESLIPQPMPPTNPNPVASAPAAPRISSASDQTLTDVIRERRMSTPVTLNPPASENWSVPSIENTYQREQYIDCINKILNQDWKDSFKPGQKNAEIHFDQAYQICQNDPGLHYVYALFLWRNMRPREAMEQLETATELVRTNRSRPYLAPWRLLIRLKVQDHEYEEAMRLAEEMAAELKAYPTARSFNHVENEQIVDDYVAWLGAISGFIRGPMAHQTRHRVNVPAWDERINAHLTDVQTELYHTTKSDVGQMFEEQLAYADQIQQSRDYHEQYLRDTNQRARDDIRVDKRNVNAHRRDYIVDGWNRPTTYYWRTPWHWSWSRWNPEYRRRRHHYLRGHFNDVKTQRNQTRHDTPDKAPIRFPYAINTYLPDNAEQERQQFMVVLRKSEQMPIELSSTHSEGPETALQ